MSRTEVDVFVCKEALENAIKRESEEKDLIDVLETAESLYITEDILRKTMIGKSMFSIQKKYSATAIGKKAKEIIQKWKTACDLYKAKESPKKAKESPKKLLKPVSIEVPKASPQPISTDIASPEVEEVALSPRSAAAETADSEAFDDEISCLSTVRKNCIDTFVKAFKDHANVKSAQFIAFLIEKSINAMHDADSDKNGYKTKFLALISSVRKNGALRTRLLEGELNAGSLVHMSAGDLATAEQRKLRAGVAEAVSNERRSDFMNSKKDEIALACGIDPNQGGEFKCRKCKSDKTTHYEKQTRSSDEPMTVFVQCINCGNRWRF